MKGPHLLQDGRITASASYILSSDLSPCRVYSHRIGESFLASHLQINAPRQRKARYPISPFEDSEHLPLLVNKDRPSIDEF